jgi:hypothetical protein
MGPTGRHHADVRFLTIAAAAIATGGIGLAAAHADNDYAFIQAITGDGISMDRNDAISQAHAVCLFLKQPRRLTVLTPSTRTASDQALLGGAGGARTRDQRIMSPRL